MARYVVNTKASKTCANPHQTDIVHRDKDHLECIDVRRHSGGEAWCRIGEQPDFAEAVNVAKKRFKGDARECENCTKNIANAQAA